MAGWYTASSGGTKVGSAGASYTVNGNITLYAQWTSSKIATPTDLSAYSGGSFVQISFNEVSLASSYKLYRSSSASGTYSEITASGGSSGNKYVLTDSSPQSGTRYYKVRAIPPSGYGFTESDLSDYVSVTR